MSDTVATLPKRARNGEEYSLDKNANEWIAKRLADPAFVLESFDGLEAFWRHTVIILKCERPMGYEHGPWVSKNFRGAVGDVLKRDAGKNRASDRPSALVGLLDQHLIIGGRHVPSPIIFSVYETVSTIEFVITLIGFADIWRDDVIFASLAALDGGIRLTEDGNVYPAIQLQDWYWYRKERFPTAVSSKTLRLQLLSPMVTDSSGGVSGNFGALLSSIAHRVRLLARWQRVELLMSGAEINKANSLVTTEFDPSNPSVPYTRRSRHNRDKKIKIYANASGVRYHNVPRQLALAMKLGQTCKAGASIAHGFGDYRCFFEVHSP